MVPFKGSLDHGSLRARAPEEHRDIAGVQLPTGDSRAPDFSGRPYRDLAVSFKEDIRIQVEIAIWLFV